MRTILLPTDFSENAGNALNYIAEFVKNEKCNLQIIHVVNPNVSPPDIIGTTSLIGIQIESARETLQAIENFSTAFFGEKTGVKVSTSIEMGSAAHVIKKKAEEIKADMIVMGTRGKGHNSSDKFFGTVSSSILDDAPCPVILIPKEYVFKTIDNVIFATDLDHSDPYELWKATELIKPHVAVVRCVYVVKKQEEKYTKETEQFAKYMVDHSPSIQTIFHLEVGDNIEAILEKYTDIYDAEMLIMHKSKKSVWGKIFGVSHTKKMTSKISVPLLVLGNK